MAAESMNRWYSSRRVLLPDGIRDAVVVVSEGRIVEILPAGGAPAALQGTDFGESVLMPGIVDCHVHINEPGRTDWEGFTSATRAAAAGGVTTVVDMPLNSDPVTVSVGALDLKRRAADNQLTVDCGFHGGLIPGNSGEIEALLDAGVAGIKAFLCPSGIDTFPAARIRDLVEIAPLLARHGVPLLVHAELEDARAAEMHGHDQDPQRYETWLRSRPETWETRAIAALIDIAAESGCHVHIVHLSAAAALTALRAARSAGVPVSVETCPHYLHFSAEKIPDADTRFKCAPPIRGRSNQDALWEAVADGTIDLIASDHSPCPPSLKALETGNFMAAWGGIASLQFGLAAFWTGCRRRRIGLERLSELMSAKPAGLCGFVDRGKIEPGLRADFTVWDPESSFRVTQQTIEHRHAVTPYEGEQLYGVTRATILHGELIFADGTFADSVLGQPALRQGRGWTF